MTTNNHQQLNLKNKIKLSKQLEQEQNPRYGNHLDGYQLRGGRGRMEEKAQGVRTINGQVQNRQGDVKNSIDNGETKELRCITHGHELSWGIAWRDWGNWAEWGKGGKL